uniref:Uncharacterized protein n=1 Tax=Physcomitrium patens TaxID=3218 RepID=A0A2K1KAS6_PHYPA|nr:hypothetical protein PHYPA_010067 [Physcomitrium patens]
MKCSKNKKYTHVDLSMHESIPKSHRRCEGNVFKGSLWAGTRYSGVPRLTPVELAMKGEQWLRLLWQLCQTHW